MNVEGLLVANVSTVYGGGPDQVLLAEVRGGDESLLGTVAMLPGAAAQLDPTLGAPGLLAQVAEVALLGISAGAPFEVLDSETDSGIEVDRGMEDKTSWRLLGPASSARWQPWALGYEVDYGGSPPPGLAGVNIEVRYGRGSGAFTIPVVTGGLATNSQRSVDDEGHVVQLSGMGPEARYDRARVTLQLEAGHGLTHGAIVALLAAQAGIPAAQIQIGPEVGWTLRRAVDIVDEEFWSAAADVLLGCGHAMRFSEDNALVSSARAPIYSGAPLHRFRAAHILGGGLGGVEVLGVAERATCIRVEGEKPVLPEDLGAGDVLQVTVNKIFQTGFFPRRAAYNQKHTIVDPDEGILDAVSGENFWRPNAGFFYGPGGRTLKSMTVTAKVLRGGCLIAEEVLVSGWSVPEAARYTYAGDVEGTKIATNDVWIFDPDAVAGDEKPAYRHEKEMWSLLSRDRKDYTYGGGEDGKELSSVLSRTGGYLNPTRRAKVPSHVQPYTWPDEVYDEGTFILGGGRVVKDSYETFRGAGQWGEFDYLKPWVEYMGDPWGNSTPLQQPLTQETLDYSSLDGYVTRTTAERKAFVQVLGDGNWFEGDYTSSQPHQTYEDNEVEVTTFNAAPGDSQHKKVTIRTDNISGEDSAQVEDVEGYLPAVTRCDETDQGRMNGIPFSAEVCWGLSYRVNNLRIVRSDWIEDEIQARFLAEVLLREEQAIPVRLTLPLNATIRPGDTASVYIPDLHLAHRGWVERVEIVNSERTRHLKVTVRLHPNG